MNFIDAVIEISKRKDLSFCDSKDELKGKYPSICIYKNNNFIGKLRWPYQDYSLSDKREAGVDEELKKELKLGKK